MILDLTQGLILFQAQKKPPLGGLGGLLRNYKYGSLSAEKVKFLVYMATYSSNGLTKSNPIAPSSS